MNDLGIPLSAERIVIVGGGFAGLYLAQKISSRFQVVLLDKNNYHNFQPLLYQVATGGLEADSIAYPLRKSLKKNIYFRMLTVKKIDSPNNLIETSAGNLNYHILIIATGSKPNFYGNESIEKNAFPLKSISDALNIRSWLFQNLEYIVLKRNNPFSIAVVGGGPTGVEVAGALADLKNHVLPYDYKEIDFSKAEIYLIEASDRLLGTMSKKSSVHAQRYLEQMGIKIILNHTVKSFDGKELVLSENHIILTPTLIWSAGVIGNPISGLDGHVLLKNMRYKVDSYNRIIGYKNIFAIGDVAGITDVDQPHPMLAPVAIQQAENLARNLNNPDIRYWKKFHYINKGVLATVGRNKALVEIANLKFHGFFAWIIWIFVHLMTLVGFRNRMIVFVNWVLNYIKYDSAIRLIIRPVKKRSKRL